MKIEKHINDDCSDDLTMEDGHFFHKFDTSNKWTDVGSVGQALQMLLNPPQYTRQGCDEWAHEVEGHMSDPAIRALLNAHHQGLVKISVKIISTGSPTTGGPPHEQHTGVNKP